MVMTMTTTTSTASTATTPPPSPTTTTSVLRVPRRKRPSTRPSWRTSWRHRAGLRPEDAALQGRAAHEGQRPQGHLPGRAPADGQRPGPSGRRARKSQQDGLHRHRPAARDPAAGAGRCPEQHSTWSPGARTTRRRGPAIRRPKPRSRRPGREPTTPAALLAKGERPPSVPSPQQAWSPGPEGRLRPKRPAASPRKPPPRPPPRPRPAASPPPPRPVASRPAVPCPPAEPIHRPLCPRPPAVAGIPNPGLKRPCRQGQTPNWPTPGRPRPAAT